MSGLFPSIIPEAQTLTEEEVREIFDDNYNLLRQAAVVINDVMEYDTEINGKSNKLVITSWIASNCSRQDAETIRDKAQERL